MDSIQLNSLKSLTIFKSLFESGSATRTAESLGITQSGVSRALTTLEETLGLKLFRREKNRLQATPEAAELYDDVLRLLEQVDELKHSALALREFGASRLRIASIPGLAYGFLPRTIAALLEQHAKLNVCYDVMSTHEVVRAVESERSDIGFVTLPVVADALELEEIVRTEAVCLVHRRSPLARRSTIELADLAGQHLVVANQPNLAADQLLKLLREQRIRLAGKTESNISAVCALVSHGAGVSVINPITAHDLAAPNTLTRPFRPAIHYSFGMLHQRRWADSRILTTLRKILRDSKHAKNK